MASQTHARGGRPTSYKAKYVDELIAYFEEFVDEPFTKEVTREEISYYKEGGKKKETRDYKFVGKRLPTLFGFSRKIGVNYTTVYRWAEGRVGKAPEEGEKDTRPYKYPEFRNAYKSREFYQTEFLTALGLGGIAPPSSVIFTSKNVIGWRDTTDQRFVDKDGKDRGGGGYVLLPAREKQEDESGEEKDESESDGV